MEMNRKDLEQLIASLKPTGLSDRTLSRLEMVMSGQLEADASHAGVENSLHAIAPRALSDDTFDKLFGLVENVAFPMNEKVCFSPALTRNPRKPNRYVVLPLPNALQPLQLLPHWADLRRYGRPSRANEKFPPQIREFVRILTNQEW